MSIAVFPGSFDPVTTGHVDLILRAAQMFDKLVIGVLVNSAKQPVFSMEDRVAMLQEIVSGRSNIEVCSFEGLLVDFVEKQKADVIVRGLRTSVDFEYRISGDGTGVFLYQFQCGEGAFEISCGYFRVCTGECPAFYKRTWSSIYIILS